MDGSDERTFLHDIASPLGTAIFLMDVLLEMAQKRATQDPEESLRIKQVCESLAKIEKMLRARREVLIKKGVPSARE